LKGSNQTTFKHAIKQYLYYAVTFHRILVSLILVLLLSGVVVISATYTFTILGDFIEISLVRISIELPKSWNHIQGEIRFGNGLDGYILMTDNTTALRLLVYDLDATESYMSDLNSTSTSQLLEAEIAQLAAWYSENYPSSELRLIDSGLREISNIEASFVTAIVSRVGNVTMKLTMVAFMYDGLVELSFASTFERYEAVEAIFDHVLNSIRLR